MNQDATPAAIRMLDALDPEGYELFDAVCARGGGEDGWGENVMAARIAARVPDPVALSHRQLVALSEKLLDEFIEQSRDETGHDMDDCAVPACERCSDYWSFDGVQWWLLDKLDRRRNAWLIGEQPGAAHRGEDLDETLWSEI